MIASTKLINDPANPSSRTDDFNKDIRDPVIFDPTLTIARFVKVGAHTRVRNPVVAGLAEDYIGYIVPAYNYALDPSDPYIVEAEGDHYEEVYSLGPLCEQHVVHPILELLRHRSP